MAAATDPVAAALEVAALGGATARGGGVATTRGHRGFATARRGGVAATTHRGAALGLAAAVEQFVAAALNAAALGGTTARGGIATARRSGVAAATAQQGSIRGRGTGQCEQAGRRQRRQNDEALHGRTPSRKTEGDDTTNSVPLRFTGSPVVRVATSDAECGPKDWFENRPPSQQRDGTADGCNGLAWERPKRPAATPAKGEDAPRRVGSQPHSNYRCYRPPRFPVLTRWCSLRKRQTHPGLVLTGPTLGPR